MNSISPSLRSLEVSALDDCLDRDGVDFVEGSVAVLDLIEEGVDGVDLVTPY